MPLSKSTIDAVLSSPHGEAAYKVVEKLHDEGFDTWWVGGTVREMLQDIVPHDIDIATAATPDQIQKIFPKMQDAGRQFGGVVVPMGKFAFEVTTFREDDAASDGRHPESVVFGTREQDAKRRDFTINAMYWNPISSEIYDPYDGEGDLHEKLIRFIDDPSVRIRHDALRLMRAIRFRAKIDGQYEPETYKALQKYAKDIQTLSGSRILQEIEKMLTGPLPQKAFEDLWETGILGYTFPELHACKGVAQPADFHHEGDVWEHILRTLRSFRPEDDVDVRIAALFHDCGKAETFSRKERIHFDHHAPVSAKLFSDRAEQLQMPKKRREKIAWLIEHHMTMATFLPLAETRKAHWYFHPWFADLLRLFWLDVAGTDPSNFSLYEDIVKDYNIFLNAHPRPQKPLISGEEVMQVLGIQPGEAVGKALLALHDAQTEGKVTTKKEAQKFLESLGK